MILPSDRAAFSIPISSSARAAWRIRSSQDIEKCGKVAASRSDTERRADRGREAENDTGKRRLAFSRVWRCFSNKQHQVFESVNIHPPQDLASVRLCRLPE